jgi:CheY-like chemotaxis protein
MAVVRVIHWKEAEAGPLLAACRAAGLETEYLEGDGGAICRAVRTKPPDVIAIDLSRLPSHGREVAVWLRNTKSTRHIPIVFIGGQPAKVEGVRSLLPDAAYCELPKLGAALKKLAKSGRAKSPVTPPQMMDRYREKSAAEKLGITAKARVAVIDSPRNFPDLLGPLPDDVEFQDDPAPLTLWFVHNREGLMESLRQMRALAAKTKLWLLWRKGSTGPGLTQNALRETASAVGLVDYRICAIDGRWSAMCFARRKS